MMEPEPEYRRQREAMEDQLRRRILPLLIILVLLILVLAGVRLHEL